MAEDNSRKRKRDYHLMLFIDNEKGEINQMGISRIFVEVLAAIVAVALIVSIVGWSVNSSAKKELTKTNKELSTRVEELTTQVGTLSATNEELNNKITILSDTVNTKVEQEVTQRKEDDTAHMPEGFPLSSSASMKNDENDNKIIVFTCSSGANIIAAGAGTVTSVLPDTEYGYCVQIDHENGYITEYYNPSTPLVKEGNQVLEGSILYVVEDGSDKMIYKMYHDGEQIDPMEVIKIDG